MLSSPPCKSELFLKMSIKTEFLPKSQIFGSQHAVTLPAIWKSRAKTVSLASWPSHESLNEKRKKKLPSREERAFRGKLQHTQAFRATTQHLMCKFSSPSQSSVLALECSKVERFNLEKKGKLFVPPFRSSSWSWYSTTKLILDSALSCISWLGK